MEISIIIRVHGNETFVNKAINSALLQTFPKDKFEIIVMEDLITNNVKEILSYYDEKINVINANNLGPIKSINKGIRLSKGDYYILLDSDDLLMPHALERTYSVVGKHGFVYGDYYEKSRKKMIYYRVGKNILNTIAGGILFNKNKVINVGLYDEKLIFPEYDLIKKLEKNDATMLYLKEPLYIYFRRKDSTTANKNRVKKGIKQLEERYGKMSIRGY